MSDRILSELFPRFVKKSQLEHLAKGPFGEGLLEKQGKRVYLKPGEQAPEGANVQTGARGGKYYDEPGGGGAAQPEEERRATYDMGSVTREVGVPMTPEQEQQIQEQQQAATAHISDRPATYDIGSVPITIGEEITPEQEQALEDQRQSAGQPESETPKERYDKWKASIVPEVSEVTFDGEGNIQFPGAVDDRGRTTKRSISDLRERGVYDHETMNQLVDAYENETGANVPDIMQYDYVGSDVQAYRRGLNRDAWEDKINFATQNFGDKYDPNDIAEAESFLDWIESKDTSETQKMVKMMQTYNVDNRRRDPIVLSNRGGRQR